MKIISSCVVAAPAGMTCNSSNSESKCCKLFIYFIEFIILKWSQTKHNRKRQYRRKTESVFMWNKVRTFSVWRLKQPELSLEGSDKPPSQVSDMTNTNCVQVFVADCVFCKHQQWNTESCPSSTISETDTFIFSTAVLYVFVLQRVLLQQWHGLTSCKYHAHHNHDGHCVVWSLSISCSLDVLISIIPVSV